MHETKISTFPLLTHSTTWDLRHNLHIISGETQVHLVITGCMIWELWMAVWCRGDHIDNQVLHCWQIYKLLTKVCTEYVGICNTIQAELCWNHWQSIILRGQPSESQINLPTLWAKMLLTALDYLVFKNIYAALIGINFLPLCLISEYDTYMNN